MSGIKKIKQLIIINFLMLMAPMSAFAQLPILYHDNFSTFDNETWTVYRGDWLCQDGELRQNNNSVSFAKVIVGSQQWRDYTLVVDYRMLGGNGYPAGGIIFRYLDNGNYYALEVYDSEYYGLDLRVRLKKVEGGQITIIGDFNVEADSSDWYTLRLEVELFSQHLRQSRRLE